jgi:hypothetical protein
VERIEQSRKDRKRQTDGKRKNINWKKNTYNNWKTGRVEDKGRVE